MPAQRVTVLGGGIGGLTVALALMDAGFEVAFHEQTRHLGEVGAGVQVAPNAGKVLHHPGLGPALAASGAEAGITGMPTAAPGGCCGGASAPRCGYGMACRNTACTVPTWGHTRGGAGPARPDGAAAGHRLARSRGVP